jgi:hypothetical protein
MATSDDRMQILRMLEHGKLSAEDAIRMIEALSKGRPVSLRRSVVEEARWLRGPDIQRFELTIS